MKKNYISLLMIVFLISGCTIFNKNTDNENHELNNVKDIVNSNYIEVEKLPNNYSIEQAIEDNNLVITYNKIYNYDLYDIFLNNVKDQKDAIIRIIQTTVEGDIVITDIIYKENNITVITDNTRDKYSSDDDRKIFTSQYDMLEEMINTNESGNVRNLIAYNKDQKDNYKVILSLELSITKND